MGDDYEALFGHNSGGAPTLTDTSRAELEILLEPIMARRDQFVRAMTNATVRNREEAGNAADLLKLARGFADKVGELREQVSQPLYEAHRGVVALEREFLTPMERLIGSPDPDPLDEGNAGTVHGKILAWQAVERDARARQKKEQAEDEARRAAAAGQEVPEAARLEEPAARAPVLPARGRAALKYAEAQAPAPVADAKEGVAVAAPSVEAETPVRGNYGATLGRGKAVAVEIEDITKIGMDILDTDAVRAAILKVAKAMATHVKTIPGVKITRTTVNRIS